MLLVVTMSPYNKLGLSFCKKKTVLLLLKETKKYNMQCYKVKDTTIVSYC